MSKTFLKMLSMPLSIGFELFLEIKICYLVL